MLTNEFILVISKRYTLRPLGICLGPSQIVYVRLNTINGVVVANAVSWSFTHIKNEWSQDSLPITNSCRGSASLPPHSPPPQRRHKTTHCITEYRDQCKANGLAFTPVYLYGALFFHFFSCRGIVLCFTTWVEWIRRKHIRPIDLFLIRS